MPRASSCPVPPPSLGPARTTLARDACRAHNRARFLNRGGRPRRSIWWRAWLARLLPHTDAASLSPVSASLATATKILSITFDGAIDGDATTASPSQLALSDGVDTFPGLAFVDAVGAVLRIAMDLPGAIPLELTAAYSPGPGDIIAASGARAEAFAGIPVTLA